MADSPSPEPSFPAAPAPTLFSTSIASDYPYAWSKVAKEYEGRGGLDLPTVRSRLLFDLPTDAEPPDLSEPVTPLHLRFLEVQPRSAVTLAACLLHYQPVRPLLDSLRKASSRLLAEVFPTDVAVELPETLVLLNRRTEEVRKRLYACGWVFHDGVVKRYRPARGGRRFLILEASRSLCMYLSALPKPFADSTVAKQVHALLDPVFPDLLSPRQIQNDISKERAHTRQFTEAFAKRGRSSPKPSKD